MFIATGLNYWDQTYFANFQVSCGESFGGGEPSGGSSSSAGLFDMFLFRELY